MSMTKLTLERVEVRAVLVPLRRPVVSRVGLYEEWPLILIDLYTKEGIVGRSYLAPYLKQAVRYIVPAIQDLAASRQNRPIAPLDDFAAGRKALGLVGLEGVSLIAVSGLDMAAWDALAKAAEVPLAVHLGASLAPVPAYNSNGLWLTPLDTLAREAEALVAEGGFSGVKLRLGRERIEDDIAAIRLVREVLGPDGHIMSDFNQGLSLGDALNRCHGLEIRACTGSRSRSPTTTFLAMPGSRASSGRRSCSARTSMGRAPSMRRSRRARATTSCRT
jgi:mandelate racemase